MLGGREASHDATARVCAPAPAADQQDLVRRLAANEPAAFDALVSLYHDRVRRLAARVLGWPAAADVDDVVQEVFVSVLESAKSFRGRSSVMTWLTVITLNKCRTRRRSLRSWLSMLGRAKHRQAPQPPPNAQCPMPKE